MTRTFTVLVTLTLLAAQPAPATKRREIALLDSGHNPAIQMPSLTPVPDHAQDPRPLPYSSRNQPYSYWLPLGIGGILGLIISNRFWIAWLKSRLHSSNAETVLRTARSLSRSPRHADLLLKRWGEEWERVQSHRMDARTTQPILKEIQKSIDRLQHHTSWALGWQRVSWRDRWPEAFHRFYRLTSRWIDWDELRKRNWEARLEYWIRIPVHQITGARLERCRTAPVLGPIRLRNARMNGIHLSGTSMQGADLRGSTLHNADLSESQMERCSFYQVQAHQARFDNTEMSNCAFVGAELTESTFISSVLDDADFRHSDITRASFFQASLRRVNGSYTSAARASFLYSDMRESMWEGANLRECELGHGWLKRADFHDADLTKANAHTADLSSCNLQNTDCTLVNAFESDFRRANLLGMRWSGMCLLNSNLMSARASTEFLSYAFIQDALLDEEQIQRVMQWNEEHLDAPWLQDDWAFWWEHVEWQHGIDWRDDTFSFEDVAYEIQCELHELQTFLHPTF